jgi:hypothetical protein
MASFLDKVNEARGGANTPNVPTVGKGNEPQKNLFQKIASLGEGSAAGAGARGFTNSLSFGMLDEANAGIYSLFDALMGKGKDEGGGYENRLAAERKMQGELQEEHPVASVAGEVGGAVLPSLMTGGGAAAPTLMSAVGRSAATGAAQAGAQGFGEGEGGFGERMKNAADSAIWGGAFGSVLGAGGHAVSKAAANRAANKTMKAITTMKGETNSAYDAALNTGEVIPGTLVTQHLNDAATKIRTSLGYRAQLNPSTEAVLEDMDKLVTAPTPNGPKPIDLNLAELDKMQQKVWDVYKGKDPTTKRHLLDVIKALDDAAEQGAANGSPLLKQARNKSRMERNTKIFDEAMEDAKLGSSAGSGDLTTQYRQKARALLKSKKYSQFFNEDEKAALQQIVEGTTPGNLSRYIGRFAPNSGNMASLISAMTMYHNPALAIPAIAGSMLSKAAGTSSTAGTVNEARRVLSGSPQPVVKPSVAAPAAAGAAGATAAQGMPSLLDLTGVTQAPPNQTLMQIQDLRMRQLQQQQGQ